jgi:hypothetical protein
MFDPIRQNTDTLENKQYRACYIPETNSFTFYLARSCGRTEIWTARNHKTDPAFYLKLIKNPFSNEIQVGLQIKPKLTYHPIGFVPKRLRKFILRHFKEINVSAGRVKHIFWYPKHPNKPIIQVEFPFIDRVSYYEKSTWLNRFNELEND